MHELSRAEKVRLGAFLLTALAALGAFALWLAADRLSQRTKEFYTEFPESVEGLVEGAEVTMSGVKVGTVTAIDVHPERVGVAVVHFQVEDKVPVKKDMLSVLSGGLTITGLKSVALVGGSDSSAALESGSLIPAGTSQMQKITGQAEAIAYKVEEVVNRMLVLTDAQNLENTKRLINNWADVGENTNALLRENGPAIHSILRSADSTARQAELLSKRLNAMAMELEKAKTLEKLARAADNAEKTTASLKGQMDNLPIKDGVQQMAEGGKRFNQILQRSQENLDKSLKNLRETSDNMADFSRQIKDNPSLLLRSEDKRERVRR